MNALSEGTTSEVDNSVEQLRCILESQQNRKFSDAETEEIATSLLSLFEVLAEGDSNDEQ
ncbi:hypothetical protein EB118_14355 [bacterium]|nr:hypothetical protein [bacterium]NBX98343.1 hypothetical protein [bacterium]NDC95240.1 hypothetical protein [bacterium]NDD84993.1 hypothetical protein [bacterium]NDG31239.1 hypothetical protein [bacterium]